MIASGSFLSFLEISYLIPFSVASSIKLFTLLSFLLNGRKSFLIFWKKTPVGEDWVEIVYFQFLHLLLMNV